MIIMICNLTVMPACVMALGFEATVMSGPPKGNNVFIPHIIYYTEDDDKEFPFKMKRKQFPVVPAYAMMINKTQVQSIYHVGIYLESPVFAHGAIICCSIPSYFEKGNQDRDWPRGYRRKRERIHQKHCLQGIFDQEVV
ncbi:Helitron helicase-like protein [Phytophthora palmivora]|uniref:Helitron helicase-like protein n=1 Tax=Phytophthora palmivora TaxID=4796 RepID=A0A2P4Y1B0_9STRA|nr:Helitron helicase-like protein [Phytophthora palmivora]